MNKIKQNKITFTLILLAITIIFSSLTILSLPVLFNYKSKVVVIEKNFYKNFKFYLNSSKNITYKPFPKPHLLVENASINLNELKEKDKLIETTNLKIFISLKDIYTRSFNNFTSLEISNTNLQIDMPKIKELRRHLYKKINKPIILKNCKIFIKNNKNEVILISPIKKILYKINNKAKTKILNIDGQIFGLDFNSEWKRNYNDPNTSLHNINIFNPSVEIKNKFELKNLKAFDSKSQILYGQESSEYNIQYKENIINIISPNMEKTNFNINSKIQLKPFYFEGLLTIKNRKIENIMDSFLLNLLLYDESLLGNINGLLKIKFDKLNNKFIKKGEIDLYIKEKKISLSKLKFNLDKIGNVNSSLGFVEDKGDIKLILKNQLNIKNHIEFAKLFQIGSKKVKDLKIISFDVIKNIGETDFIITNVKIDNIENNQKSDKIFIIKNIQNLRAHIRQVIN